MAGLKLITFRKSGKGFVCNQTNEYVPSDATKSYRGEHTNRLLRKLGLQKGPPAPLPDRSVLRADVKMFTYDRPHVTCPHCSSRQSLPRNVRTSLVTCDQLRCKKRFKATVAAMPEVSGQYDPLGMFTVYSCPHCDSRCGRYRKLADGEIVECDMYCSSKPFRVSMPETADADADEQEADFDISELYE